MEISTAFAMASRASFLILTLASAVSVTSAHQTDLLFSYAGSNGPANWGNLSPNYSACGAGKVQSPINIMKNQTVANKNLKALTRDYRPANATLVNNGFNVGVLYDEGKAGVLMLDGKNYSLKQMHWHSPAEHTIDGTQYPVELHLVHSAADGSIAVVAVLYDYGQADPFLSKIQDKLVELAKDACSADEEAHIPLGLTDTKHIKRNTRKYYRYIGSLTAPPCTENVTWSILGKVRTVSKEQVDLLQAPLGGDYKNNNRPLQPLNGRRVELYDEMDDN